MSDSWASTVTGDVDESRLSFDSSSNARPHSAPSQQLDVEEDYEELDVAGFSGWEGGDLLAGVRGEDAEAAGIGPCVHGAKLRAACSGPSGLGTEGW